ncbi:hypothetical protein [Pantoea rwandensis]|uniref:Uncharacterized protein n=1 Tax=Pantoea rwandensis TaxID=1076550 RepID=A0A1X1D371_9GAMM|nr:hypothetical protein [Pantoea rwandensis]ORM71086.1 hypothetical protein HA51_04145 [Pantoea rwandensis]
MNTHNFNVNTATPESPKTWVKTPSALWLERKNDLLVHLAGIEGELMMFDALERMGVEWEEENDLRYCAREAAITVESLSEMGAVNSEAVYEMVKSVEALAINSGRIFWWDIHPRTLPGLQTFLECAAGGHEKFVATETEKQKPFSVDVEGRTEYPEDDPVYGTFWRDSVMHLGRALTLAEAMEIAAAAWLEDEWDPRQEDRDYYDSDFGRDMGPVSFSPRMFIIHDSERRRVLTGDARAMSWYAHVTDPAEVDRIAAEQQALREEAAMESGWDNFETARQLRERAEKTGAPVVDAVWLGHRDVNAALAAFVRPERRTWGSKLNTRGLSSSLAADMKSLIALSDRTYPVSRWDRYEALHSVALSIAGHVSRSVTDWSLRCPRIPAAVISAWLLTQDIITELFGETGEMVWQDIKGSLISHLYENRLSH